MTAQRIEGGCQCGAVRYALNVPPLMAYACHCSECRHVTGSAFSLSCIVMADSMEILSGTLARTEWTADSGTRRYGEFCSQCGTRIRHGSEPDQGIYSLRGGTLDDPRWATPVAHTWQRSKVAWFTPPEDALVYGGQPEDYAPIMERYAQLMGLA